MGWKAFCGRRSARGRRADSQFEPLVPNGRRIDPERRGDARVRRLLAQLREFEPRVDNRALRRRCDGAGPRHFGRRSIGASL
jgi:hypothetical protein